MVGTAVLVGGTTASGKSALALELAHVLGAVVVNADSQQLFADLPILTARPNGPELERAEHLLYGVLGPADQPSIRTWSRLLAPILEERLAAGQHVIVVGGTGLYLHALLHGLSPIPEVPAQLRANLAAATTGLATPELHARLAELDPAMASRLRPSDRQRVLRALEVLQATGKSLLSFQTAPRRRLVELRRPVGIALLPPPVVTTPRIEARLETMLEAGAVAEVALLAERLPTLGDLPIANVHGVRDILAYLAGRQGRPATHRSIALQIRRYAKRQRTFVRHQLPELEPQETVGDGPLQRVLVQHVVGRVREAQAAARSGAA